MLNYEILSEQVRDNKIIVVNKAVGPSSFAVGNYLRKFLQLSKVGHLGTLDPFAEGVLPLFFNKATNIIPYIENCTKTYRTVVALGMETDSYDSSGALSKSCDLTYERYCELLADDARLIRDALAVFVGVNRQEIPLYSAKKVKGKKLYEYARSATSVEKQYKTITVTQAHLQAWHGLLTASELAGLETCEQERLFKRRSAALHSERAWPLAVFWSAAPQAPPVLTVNDREAELNFQSFGTFVPVLYLDLEFTVSKGAFIRALVAELGRKLGCYATALRLRRTAVGPFSLETACSELAIKEQVAALNPSTCVTAAGAAEAGRQADFEFPLVEALGAYPLLELDDKACKALAQGKILTFCPKNEDKDEFFSTSFLLKKIRNFERFSIIDNGILMLAQVQGQPVGMVQLKVAETDLQRFADQLIDTGFAALAEETLLLKAERMLVSGENL